MKNSLHAAYSIVFVLVLNAFVVDGVRGEGWQRVGSEQISQVTVCGKVFTNEKKFTQQGGSVKSQQPAGPTCVLKEEGGKGTITLYVTRKQGEITAVTKTQTDYIGPNGEVVKGSYAHDTDGNLKTASGNVLFATDTGAIKEFLENVQISNGTGTAGKRSIYDAMGKVEKVESNVKYRKGLPVTEVKPTAKEK